MDGAHRDPDRMLALLLAALRAIERRRPEVPLEVFDEARDRASDALMRRPALGRLPSGKVSPARISALARRHFVWALKSSQRRRLNEDGSRKASPRAAESLDVSLEGPDGEARTMHERVEDIKADTLREVCARETLVTLAEAAADHGHETVVILNGYIRGDSVEEIADAAGLRENTVSVRKRRFVDRLRAAADGGSAKE